MCSDIFFAPEIVAISRDNGGVILLFLPARRLRKNAGPGNAGNDKKMNPGEGNEAMRTWSDG